MPTLGLGLNKIMKDYTLKKDPSFWANEDWKWTTPDSKFTTGASGIAFK